MSNWGRRPALGALAALFLAAIPATAQREPIMDSISPERVQRFLGEIGFSDSRMDQDRDVIVMMRNYKVLIIVGSSKGRYLAVRFSVTGTAVTHQTMADWNETKLFSAAYIDSDGDAILESDLDLEGGVTPDRIKDFFTTFDYSLGQFIAMIGA
jgi:hypothetical protein